MSSAADLPVPLAAYVLPVDAPAPAVWRHVLKSETPSGDKNWEYILSCITSSASELSSTAGKPIPMGGSIVVVPKFHPGAGAPGLDRGERGAVGEGGGCG